MNLNRAKRVLFRENLSLSLSPIVVRLRPHEANDAYCFRLAAQTVVVDARWPVLAPFAIGERATVGPMARVPLWSGGETPFVGEGQLGQALRHVACRADAAGYHVEVAGAGVYWIAADGQRAVRQGDEAQGADSAVLETVLGPVLVLALALREVFCLHAGAACHNGRTVAFIGESGRGKSTLAAYLGEQAAWRRIADDVLPVTVQEDIVALPHFPQLKLAPEQQPAVGLPQKVPLTAVYVLAESETGDVAVETLSPSAGALALVRHTVAARLFDKGLLARHLHFAARVAASLPVKRLRYPRRLSALAAVAAALAADVA